MEQFFVIIAFLIFWVVRGVAGAGKRRLPGEDPYSDTGPGGAIDITGATRNKTLEAQQRAIEALQRWEARQGLSPGREATERPASPAVPAASRTRVGRPASTTSRRAARERKEAYADIARMLDPGEQPRRGSRDRPRFEVRKEAPPQPTDPAPRPARADRETPWKSPPVPAEEPRKPGTDTKAARPGSQASSAEKQLARLERLPLAARAVVYSEILGRPRSLS